MADRVAPIAAGIDRSEFGAWLLSRVERVGDCWVWQGTLSHNGYARYKLPCRWGAPSSRKAKPVHTQVHRLAYMVMVGPIPSGLVTDHLCRTRACVNPAHLEPVTTLENLRRGVRGVRAAGRSDTPRASGKLCAPDTHCAHGHEYTPANTRLEERGRRRCRACGAARYRAWYARSKAAHGHPHTTA
jgi:hypothetical protein